MKKVFPIGCVVAAMLGAGCNSDIDESDYDAANYSGAAVTAFSLNADAAVLNNLDSVFFTINLNEATIFNADSLPYGTNVEALAVTMSTGLCSEAEFTVTRAEKEDTVINYLTSPNQKIDFSNGPVSLRLKSANGLYERVYQVKVNVHRVAADSLYWSDQAKSPLPTSLAAPVAQKSVSFGGKALCLTADAAGNHCVATSADPYAGAWTKSAVSFPKGVDVASFTATSSALYILATDGDLLTSADGGSTWTSTGESWHSVTAPYGDTLLGVKSNGTSYTATSYPAGLTQALPAGFPVSGNSAPAALATKWASAPQIITAGGRDTAGELTGTTWAFDGTQWARVGSGLPAAEGYAMAATKVCETDTVTWRVKTSTVLLAIGGKTADGASRDVYISRDMGMNWQQAADLLQLPAYIPAMWGADLLVFDTAFDAAGALPRAITPIERWEAPILYLIGGYATDGTLLRTVWRGAVNHLLFKPLQ